MTKTVLFIFFIALLSGTYQVTAQELRSDSLSEVIVRAKKIGYAKLLKACYANYLKNTPKNFDQVFKVHSKLSRNEKLQFELKGFLRFDFNNYLAFNHFLISKECKYINILQKNRNENLTLHPLELSSKLELDELKEIFKSNKYQFKSVRENNEFVELAFAPKQLIFQSQIEINSFNDLKDLEISDAKRFLYKGTIRINKRDQAFEELTFHLLKSPKNTTVSLINNFKVADKYLIEEEYFNLQFIKRNNYYRLHSFVLSTDWRQINLGQSNEMGFFKLREHFVDSDQVEVVFNQKQLNRYTILHVE